MDVDFFDVPEDPVTRSAKGCLAGYLAEHRFFWQDEIKIHVEQGYEIGLPSRLHLRVEEHTGWMCLLAEKPSSWCEVSFINGYFPSGYTLWINFIV